MSIQLIQQYHAKVEKMIRYGGSRNESTLRKPFQDLLEAYARAKNLVLVPEVEVSHPHRAHASYPMARSKTPCARIGAIGKARTKRTTWRPRSPPSLPKAIPPFNILFEDTHTAVLYQSGEEVLRADFHDAPALDALLTAFVGYEPPEVREFHKAIEQFSADVPALADDAARDHRRAGQRQRRFPRQRWTSSWNCARKPSTPRSRWRTCAR